MFEHLLIPLDGSAMAESVVPAGAAIAQRSGARVTLLHVLERDAPTTVHGERHLTRCDEAEAYLDELARRGFPPDIDVSWSVEEQGADDVADRVAAWAARLRPDLVVMCAHGRVRLRDRLLGNLAQQVVRHHVTPVLLYRGRAVGGFPFRHILVALDGDPEHEHGLAPATKMARLGGVPVLLLLVVPTSARLAGQQAVTGAMLPGVTQELLRERQLQAADYLDEQVRRLREQGVVAVGRVARGEPSRLILGTAHEAEADLIAVGTHGKTGGDAFWSGSVTPRLLRRDHVSFLLTPVGLTGRREPPARS